MSLTLEQIQEKYKAAANLLKLRTPNPNCPACLENRRHTLKETGVYHPDAGKGLRVERKVAG